MLRTIPGALAARLAGETTLARIWRVTRRDGQVFGFTDHDRDLVVAGRTYYSVNAADGSAFTGSGDLSADASEVTVAAAQAIVERDVEAGLWNLATVDVELVDYTAPDAGVVRLHTAEIGRLQMVEGRVSVELRGFKHRLGKPVGAIVQATCDADLGDARCKVNLSLFAVTGTVTAVIDQQQFSDSARAEATAQYDGGVLTWTSGANAGRKIEVKRFIAGGSFTLFLPMSYAIAVGDAYSLTPGCNKTLTDCGGRYNNLVNFRGFPFVPGNAVIRDGGTA